jgi:hypothetical protein
MTGVSGTVVQAVSDLEGEVFSITAGPHPPSFARANYGGTGPASRFGYAATSKGHVKIPHFKLKKSLALSPCSMLFAPC